MGVQVQSKPEDCIDESQLESPPELLALLPKLKLHDAHKRLTLHQDQQMQIFNNNTNYAVFKEVLPKLSDLQRVSVTLEREFDPYFWETPDPKPPFDHWSGLALRSLPCSGVHQVDAVMTALAVSLSREKLRHLQLGPFHWDYINQLNDSPLKLDQVVDICQHLTTFEIAIRGESTDEDPRLGRDVIEDDIRSCRRAISQRSLCKILAATLDLHELTVRFAHKWQDVGASSTDIAEIDFPATIDDFLPADYHWRNLKKVELQTVEFAPQQLFDFLERHASTLESAMFRNIRLVNESWLIFLPQMRGLKTRLARNLPQTPRLHGKVCFAGYLYGEFALSSSCGTLEHG